MSNEHRPDDEAVPADEVRVGDVVVALYKEVGGSGYPIPGAFDSYGAEWEITAAGEDGGHWIKPPCKERGKRGGTYLSVSKTSRVWIRKRSGSASKPAVSGEWNGKCPACGKGTYTGLFKTEHDGPCR